MIAKRYGGKVEAVWANKGKNDCVKGTCVLDLERGVVDRIWDEPWQTDTCIGHWHYDKEATYKTPKIVIDMLVDIVSRNGNLLLNFPLPSNGMLDPQELKILDEMTRWMAVNGEAIYGTRPWKMYGDGPAVEASQARRGSSEHHQAGAFNESGRKPLTASDIRFTQKGGALYAFAMGRPEARVTIPALAPGGAARCRQDPKRGTARGKREAGLDAGCGRADGSDAGDAAVRSRRRFEDRGRLSHERKSRATGLAG